MDSRSPSRRSTVLPIAVRCGGSRDLQRCGAGRPQSADSALIQAVRPIRCLDLGLARGHSASAVMAAPDPFILARIRGDPSRLASAVTLLSVSAEVSCRPGQTHDSWVVLHPPWGHCPRGRGTTRQQRNRRSAWCRHTADQSPDASSCTPNPEEKLGKYYFPSGRQGRVGEGI